MEVPLAAATFSQFASAAGLLLLPSCVVVHEAAAVLPCCCCAVYITGKVAAFNVPVEAAAERLAEREGIEIVSDRVVYRLLESVTESMISMLPPLTEEVTVGEGVVGQIFKLTGAKKATVAGCSVRSGQLQRKARYQVLRGRKVVHDGELVAARCALVAPGSAAAVAPYPMSRYCDRHSFIAEAQEGGHWHGS